MFFKKDRGGDNITKVDRVYNKRVNISFRGLGGILFVVLLFGLLIPTMFGGQDRVAEIFSTHNLEKIINISELSTSTAIYNGVAEKYDNADPSTVDYYVSYKARVKAGFDFEKLEITVDEEKKKITVSIPEIYITDIQVDIDSMEFIFFDQSTNTPTVSQQAYSICERDVRAETKDRAEIFSLARQSAIKTVSALLSPLVSQIGDEYTLVIR